MAHRIGPKLEQYGYKQIPSKLSGNKGIDFVFVKANKATGAVEDILVIESKFSMKANMTTPDGLNRWFNIVDGKVVK